MSRPPRVVMLVDNTVDGDSRVQKSARFMASLGWDVTLLGRSPSNKVQEERLGEATLLRVPAPLTLSTRRRLAPGRSLRRPLAYPDHETAAAADARNAWRRVDLQTRLAGASTLSGLAPRVLGKARRGVHRVRSKQYKAAVRAAGQPRTRAGLAWHRTRNQWAFDDPFLADLEVAFAPVLARLAPDLVHAHDFKSIGIAVRYKQRAQAKKGATVPVVVYDAHEYLPGVGIPDARRRRGNEAYERFHLAGIDGLVAAAPRIAATVRETHGVPHEATIVLNAPEAASGTWTGEEPDIRTAAGVPDGAPIVTYVGVSAEKRGITPVVEALAQLPEVHVVLVTKRNPYVVGLEKAAAEQGYADRLHVLPYVAPEDVSRFVRTADIGVSLLMDTLNHRLTLPTKVFEYAQGRLPVITSDVTASAETVREHGIGEVTPIGDVDAFAAAVRKVLADPDAYHAAYRETDLLQRWTWEAQCAPVDGLYRSLLGRGPSEAERRLRRVERALAAGEAPPVEDVTAAAAGLLAAADAAKDPKEVAAQAARAAAVLWHRTLHFDQVGSPLTDDPDGFLAPWHASRTAARVAERRSAAPASRPTRDVAVLSYKNMTFVPPLERALAELGRTSHRVDLADVAPGSVPLSPLQQVRARLSPPAPSAWSAALDEALGDSDTVWVEWGQRAAVAASLLPDRTRRTIVRLHSFESWTVFPHLVDWSAVDDLVFVGPHIRDLLVPRLRGFDPTTTRTHVVPVSLDPARWRRPKQAGAERTLAVVGWAAPAKDAVWALDLLARLRAHDSSYRLLLVGHEPASDGPAGVRQYRDAVQERLARPDVADAVERIPFTPDVPALLERVGVVLSSSVRESLHMAVVEGAASGAVPVVRDWPMLAAYDGPRRLFPPDWVVTDLDEAEDRVLRATGDAFAASGARAADDAASRYGDAAVAAQLRKVLDA